MILTKAKSRKTVRKILDEEQINYTPQQADELADALFDMIAAISNRLSSRTPAPPDAFCECPGTQNWSQNSDGTCPYCGLMRR